MYLTADSARYGATLIRVALGTMWIAHSLLLKLMTFGLSGFASWMDAQGLPAFLALPIVVAELAGGILIVAGFYGRWISLALLPIMLGAIYIHAGNGWLFVNANGGWEYPVFLAIASLAHFFIGDGAFALKREAA